MDTIENIRTPAKNINTLPVSSMGGDISDLNGSFELLLEMGVGGKNSLKAINKNRYRLKIVESKILSMKKYETQDKNNIEYYNYLKKKSEEFDNYEQIVTEFFEEKEKKDLEYYIAYEMRRRHLYELDKIKKILIESFHSFNNSVSKISEEFDKSAEILKDLDGYLEEINNSINTPSTKGFEWKGYMTYSFDNIRIDGLNSGIQHFSKDSYSIFSFFETIKGEELLDPLINIITSISDEITDDNFQSFFISFLKGGKSLDVDLFSNTDKNDSKIAIFRDMLMAYNTSIFFKNESYLYIFEVEGKRFYIKLRGDTGNYIIGEVGDFINESDVEAFIKDKLKLSVPKY